MVRIAVRNESVRLTLDDQFTSGMAKAAAAAALLKKNLDGLDGTTSKTTSSTEELGESTSKTTKKTQEYSLEIAIAEEKSARLRKALRDQARASLDAADGLAVSAVATKNVGTSSDQSGKQIDRLSGRLALLAQAASVLGPALVPLGAPLVGLMSGLTMQLGAVAGAVGVSVLAFKGLGDGMKALNAYQLEPTSENLQTMRLEMEKLGPAGADFVRFIDDLGPQLTALQRASRRGLFPGVEEGITNLLPMLPQVRDIILEISRSMGGLAADAGADLAGPEWESFFNYLENDAGPILTEFGQTVGNFAQGFAGLLVGLAPATEDFSGGLLGMSEAFAEWSAGLSGNDSFQSFVDYVRDSGPAAVETLGQIAVTFGQIIAAAAPVGDAILPILTSVLKLVGDIADSPLGTMFFTAAAGLSVYSRAAALAAGSTTRLAAAQKSASGGFAGVRANAKSTAAAVGMVALASSDLDEKSGLSNTAMLALAGSMAGPWGAAAGAAVGLTLDLAAANDEAAAAIERARIAMSSGGPEEQEAAYADLQEQIAATGSAVDNMFQRDRPDGEGLFGSILGDIEATNAGLGELINGSGNDLEFVTGQMDELRNGAVNGSAALNQLLVPGDLSPKLGQAATTAADLARQLTRVNSLLDRRGSWVDYEAAVDAATESIKENGRTLDIGTNKGRANRTALDDIAASANRLAENMKGTNRVEVLAQARKDFVDTAIKMGMLPKRARALADDLGLLARTTAKPTVELDLKGAKAKAAEIRARLAELGKMKPSPKVDAEIAAAKAKLADIRAQIAAIRDKEVTITTRQKTVIENIMGYDGPRADRKPSADGSTVPKTGLPYADRHPYLLADGEEIISNRRGQADMNRAALKAANAGARLAVVGRLASGGTAGDTNLMTPSGVAPFIGGTNLMTPNGIAPFLFDPLTTSMRGLRRELSRSEKAVERERNQRDALISKRDEVASGIREGLGGDIWGDPANPWSAGATSNPTDMLQQQTAQAREFTQLIQSLKSKGLDGAALAEVIGSGDIERARMMAALPASALRQFERAYNVNQQAMASAGAAGGQAAFGAQIAEQTREFQQANRRLNRIEAAIKAADRSNRAGQRESADRTTRGVNGAAGGGRRDRTYAR